MFLSTFIFEFWRRNYAEGDVEFSIQEEDGTFITTALLLILFSKQITQGIPGVPVSGRGA